MISLRLSSLLTTIASASFLVHVVTMTSTRLGMLHREAKHFAANKMVQIDTAFYNQLFVESPKHSQIPHVQVFMTTSPSQGMYWERFYSNANGWYQQFPAIKAFTFDDVSRGSPVAKLFTRVKLLPHERPGFDKTKSFFDNAQLAATGEMFRLNADSTWCLQVDGDTVVVKQNFERMTTELEKNGDVNETEYFLGKCVYEETDFGKVDFAVGGSGILMNQKTLRQLAPRIEECRRDYAESVTFSDARIGACLSYTLNISTEICPPIGYSMTNAGIKKSFLSQPPNNLVVTLHEKRISTIKRINEAIVACQAALRVFPQNQKAQDLLQDLRE